MFIVCPDMLFPILGLFCDMHIVTRFYTGLPRSLLNLLLRGGSYHICLLDILVKGSKSVVD